MMRPFVLVFALVLASTAQAKQVPQLPRPDDIVVTIREGCGIGYQRVAGRCVRNTMVRAFRRCAARYRLVGSRCIRRAPPQASSG